MPELEDVPSVEMDAFEAGVQEQLREAYDDAEATLGGGGSHTEIAQAYGELGRVLHAYELRDAAEPAYRNAHNLAPAEPTWAYLLAVVLQEKGDLDNAVEAFEHTLELSSGDIPARVRLGHALFDGNRLGEARQHLERALEIDPDCALALFFLGQVALAEQDFAAAAPQLERTLALQQGANSVHHALARAYRGLGDLEKAGRALELAGDDEVRLEDPRFQEMKQREVSAAGYVRRAARAQVAGVLDAALQEYRRAIEVAPENAEARAGLGATLAELGQPEEAKQQLKEAIRLGGDNAWLRYNLAGAYRLAGELDAAMAEYRAGLEQDPKHVDSMIGLADLMVATSKAGEAAKILEDALQVGEKKATVYLRLAALHIATGRAAEAQKALQAVLQSDPTPDEKASTFQQLADIARAQGDAASAIGALRAALQATPNDLGIVFSLANMLGATGQFEAAAAAYDRILKERPDRPEAWLGLATALSLSGRPDGAIEKLTAARTHLPNHPDLSLALARLYIVHPDPARRDHAQALELIDQAGQGGATLQQVELKAIALAELGRFEEAMKWQQELLEKLRNVQPQLVPAAEDRLREFRQRAKEAAS